MGRALARLSQVSWEGSALTTLDHGAFLDLHRRRVGDLSEALGHALAAALPRVPPAYPESPLVLTHGDPGPGNFLDDGADGTLIDWEDAVVAPRGLDLGRATFIAHLGAGPEGYAASEPAARADAVKAGYLAEAGDRPLSADERTWWLSVAGVQFAHRRLERAGEPGVLPWRDALTTLEAALAEPRLN
jgi:aminoglycoside phosphotransferase (APT) family kinase protein